MSVIEFIMAYWDWWVLTGVLSCILAFINSDEFTTERWRNEIWANIATGLIFAILGPILLIPVLLEFHKK